MDARPGTYALVLISDRSEALTIGKLGVLQMRPGYYVYVGSALGPGGLKSRIAHHLKAATRPRWHIDYLRAASRPAECWFCIDPVRREHRWAGMLARAKGANVPMKGFGSSDCSCDSHLFCFTYKPTVDAFRRRMRRRFDDHGTVFVEKVAASENKNLLTNNR